MAGRIASITSTPFGVPLKEPQRVYAHTSRPPPPPSLPLPPCRKAASDVALIIHTTLIGQLKPPTAVITTLTTATTLPSASRFLLCGAVSAPDSLGRCSTLSEVTLVLPCGQCVADSLSAASASALIMCQRVTTHPAVRLLQASCFMQRLAGVVSVGSTGSGAVGMAAGVKPVARVRASIHICARAEATHGGCSESVLCSCK